ncbi:kinase-like domain-containing protein [Glomus cerebriforme]|uniref:Kinase-like domain-containing protein n=1 Tax=Glomus cerebriforme TaxID=658196 RepID=A0A397TDX8_9GLOM|nr:kinase-like domain-containing protein [Glomus cerebriforme]
MKYNNNKFNNEFNNYNKPPILTIILILIIYSTYSVITIPIPNPPNSPSLSPILDNPDPSFPTLKEIDFNSIKEPGEFWEMIHVDDYSDNNSNDRKNFGTVPYFSPVWFNNAYNKFGPHITFEKRVDIDQKYKNKQWYEICYLNICMNVAGYDKKEMEECVTKFPKLRVEPYERLLKRLKSLSKVFDALHLKMGIHSLKYSNFDYLKGNLYDRKGLVELIKFYVKRIEPRYSETLNDREFQRLKDNLDFGKFSVRRLKKKSKNWTSGNEIIDEFIKDIQLKATSISEVIEWIDYDNFEDIEYLANGGFSTVYRATWINEFFMKTKRVDYDNDNDDDDESICHSCVNKKVVLKSLRKSKNITKEFLNEIIAHIMLSDDAFIIRCYGITQDPDTKNYMLVMDYARDGNLRDYLKNCKSIDLRKKIQIIYQIIKGLYEIHQKELIHKDLHPGNILKKANKFVITDLGSCQPAYISYIKTKKNVVYGVMPYMAPEILRGNHCYSTASDIYALGIIMCEIISEQMPYYDKTHDYLLALRICEGLRPKFNIKVPQLLINIIKQCLNANPVERPVITELDETFNNWCTDIKDKKDTEINLQIKEAEEYNKCLSPTSTIKTYINSNPRVFYSTRHISFEPRNADNFDDDDFLYEPSTISSVKSEGSDCKITDEIITVNS